MSEPAARAASTAEVVPGVRFWTVVDERIGGAPSTGHAVASGGRVVLIDPVPLDPEPFAALGEVEAVVLTTSSHQRSAWRLRRELGVPVYAPAPTRVIDEEPDVRYAEGDVLPAGLEPIFTPGAGTTQHSLLLRRPDGDVLFTPDLFTHPEGAALALVPAVHMHDPAQARETIARLLGRELAVLCTGHGAPVVGGVADAIRAALAAA